jgi:N-acetylmuramoyl-L-alanine amidase
MEFKRSVSSLCWFILLAALYSGCAKGPYAASNKIYNTQVKSFSKVLKQAEKSVLTDSAGQSIPVEWIGTTNFNLRKPNYVILHHTAQTSTAQTVKTFTMTKTQVSAHYVVGRNGEVVQMLNDYLRAWHGGAAKWGNVTDINSTSIGIELDNDGFEPYTDIQLNNLLLLLARLKKTYNIPAANFIGHGDIAPGRKIDPNVNFPWKKLADKGFGLWYDELLELPPVSFDPFLALRIIGYDISNKQAAVVAFKRHFIQHDLSPQLTQLDLNVLYNLQKKYQ